MTIFCVVGTGQFCAFFSLFEDDLMLNIKYILGKISWSFLGTAWTRYMFDPAHTKKSFCIHFQNIYAQNINAQKYKMLYYLRVHYKVLVSFI